MLLPSALPCEIRPRPPLHRAPAYTLASPPLSPPSSGFSTNIFSTCRALHSLLGVQSNRQPQTIQSTRTHHTRIEKRRLTIPRGVNKRRRPADDDDAAADQENLPARGRDSYSTPKRQRLVPPSIPLGLERRDFYALQPRAAPNFQFSTQIQSTYTFTKGSAMEASPPLLFGEEPSSLGMDNEEEGDDEWDSEDDSQLVDLVLEKLRLSKRDWDDCARVLGTDGGSLGRRWKELVGEGEVGLRFRRGRGMRRGDVRGVWDGLESEEGVRRVGRG